MNEQIKTAASAAKAFYEAEQALDEAKEALMPFAKQQADLTKKIAIEMGLIDHYDYRFLKYYDWIELEIGGYYRGASEIPVINANFWTRGRCGDHDSNEGSFELSEHILNGDPEKFELELRAKLGDKAAQKRKNELEQKQREIAALQAQLAKLQEAA